MDHVYGLFAFPGNGDIVAYESCRRKLLEVGESSLKEARQGDPMFEEVVLRIPNVTFDAGELLLRVGGKTFRLFSLPGHTDDNIGVMLEEEEILITGDAVMAIPIIADGDWQREIETLTAIKALAPETIVQGHGEVILRGEVQIVIDRYIAYLECVYKKAKNMLRQGRDRKEI